MDESRRDRLDELVAMIRAWNKAYYVDNKPLIPDHQYDAYYVEMRELAEKMGVSDEIDVLTRVGDDTTGVLAPVKHLRPMISLRTEVDTSCKPIDEFEKRVAKFLDGSGVRPDDIEYIAEAKYDGMSASIRYENGMISCAVTRGDGETGEDITHNATYVSNVLLVVDPKITEIRGEILLLRGTLDLINEQRENRGEKPFVNCRNAIAGLMRRKERSDWLTQAVFIPYAYYTEEKLTEADTQSGRLDDLNRARRRGGESSVLYKGPLVGLRGAYLELERKRPDMDYDIDGIVYKVDRLDLQEHMGSTGREPNWAIAHKFNPEVASTRLSSVDWQVGPSGRVTPVARVQPVFVGGTTVSNCTLSNILQIRKKNLRVGDTIQIQRAGDVIPEILPNVKPERQEYVPNVRTPEYCPSCGSRLNRRKGETNSFCPNTYQCHEQFVAQIDRLGSRKVFDIDGLGPAVGEMFWSDGAPTPFDVLFCDEWQLIEKGMGQANAAKLAANLQRLRDTPMPVNWFIHALNIPGVGDRASTRLVERYGSLEGIMTALDEIEPFEGFHTANVRDLKEFFNREIHTKGHDSIRMRDFVPRLASKFLLVNYEPNVDGVLSGKTIVVTGSEKGISREGFKSKIQTLGAKLGSSVSKNTTVLVYGDGAGDKLAKAEKLGVLTMTYSEFIAEFPESKPE